MNKAVFLDRDGTINEEVNYLYRITDFKFIPGSVEAIKILHRLGFKIVVVTNQSGVARGLYTEENIHILHNHIDKELSKRGTFIDKYYYCPHHPEGMIDDYKVDCQCRKPKIGMVKKAANDLNIDLSQSIIVGDKIIDIETGLNAGINNCILVKSGHPTPNPEPKTVKTFDTLYDFAMDLFEGEKVWV